MSSYKFVAGRHGTPIDMQVITADGPEAAIRVAVERFIDPDLMVLISAYLTDPAGRIIWMLKNAVAEPQSDVSLRSPLEA